MYILLRTDDKQIFGLIPYRERYTIGRVNADIIIDHDSISDFHAIITFINQVPHIIDVSKLGTFLDSENVSREVNQLVPVGSRIQFGTFIPFILKRYWKKVTFTSITTEDKNEGITICGRLGFPIAKKYTDDVDFVVVSELSYTQKVLSAFILKKKVVLIAYLHHLFEKLMTTCDITLLGMSRFYPQGLRTEPPSPIHDSIDRRSLFRNMVLVFQSESGAKLYEDLIVRGGGKVGTTKNHKIPVTDVIKNRNIHYAPIISENYETSESHRSQDEFCRFINFIKSLGRRPIPKTEITHAIRTGSVAKFCNTYQKKNQFMQEPKKIDLGTVLVGDSENVAQLRTLFNLQIPETQQNIELSDILVETQTREIRPNIVIPETQETSPSQNVSLKLRTSDKPHTITSADLHDDNVVEADKENSQLKEVKDQDSQTNLSGDLVWRQVLKNSSTNKPVKVRSHDSALPMPPNEKETCVRPLRKKIARKRRRHADQPVQPQKDSETLHFRVCEHQHYSKSNPQEKYEAKMPPKEKEACVRSLPKKSGLKRRRHVDQPVQAQKDSETLHAPETITHVQQVPIAKQTRPLKQTEVQQGPVSVNIPQKVCGHPHYSKPQEEHAAKMPPKKHETCVHAKRKKIALKRRRHADLPVQLQEPGTQVQQLPIAKQTRPLKQTEVQQGPVSVNIPQKVCEHRQAQKEHSAKMPPKEQEACVHLKRKKIALKRRRHADQAVQLQKPGTITQVEHVPVANQTKVQQEPVADDIRQKVCKHPHYSKVQKENVAQMPPKEKEACVHSMRKKFSYMRRADQRAQLQKDSEAIHAPETITQVQTKPLEQTKVQPESTSDDIRQKVCKHLHYSKAQKENVAKMPPKEKEACVHLMRKIFTYKRPADQPVVQKDSEALHGPDTITQVQSVPIAKQTSSLEQTKVQPESAFDDIRQKVSKLPHISNVPEDTEEKMPPKEKEACVRSLPKKSALKRRRRHADQLAQLQKDFDTLTEVEEILNQTSSWEETEVQQEPVSDDIHQEVREHPQDSNIQEGQEEETVPRTIEEFDEEYSQSDHLYKRPRDPSPFYEVDIRKKWRPPSPTAPYPYSESDTDNNSPTPSTSAFIPEMGSRKYRKRPPSPTYPYPYPESDTDNNSPTPSTSAFIPEMGSRKYRNRPPSPTDPYPYPECDTDKNSPTPSTSAFISEFGGRKYRNRPPSPTAPYPYPESDKDKNSPTPSTSAFIPEIDSRKKRKRPPSPTAPYPYPECEDDKSDPVDIDNPIASTSTHDVTYRMKCESSFKKITDEATRAALANELANIEGVETDTVSSFERQHFELLSKIPPGNLLKYRSSKNLSSDEFESRKSPSESTKSDSWEPPGNSEQEYAIRISSGSPNSNVGYSTASSLDLCSDDERDATQTHRRCKPSIKRLTKELHLQDTTSPSPKPTKQGSGPKVTEPTQGSSKKVGKSAIPRLSMATYKPKYDISAYLPRESKEILSEDSESDQEPTNDDAPQEPPIDSIIISSDEDESQHISPVQNIPPTNTATTSGYTLKLKSAKDLGIKDSSLPSTSSTIRTLFPIAETRNIKHPAVTTKKKNSASHLAFKKRRKLMDDSSMRRPTINIDRNMDPRTRNLFGDINPPAKSSTSSFVKYRSASAKPSDETTTASSAASSNDSAIVKNFKIDMDKLASRKKVFKKQKVAKPTPFETKLTKVQPKPDPTKDCCSFT